MSKKDIIQSATDDYWFLSQTAEDDLANVATDRHVSSQKNCPRCQEPVGVSFWRTRAKEGVSKLRLLQAGSKQMYLETGAQYWALDFSQKAKYAHEATCALAHEQFWISTTPRSEDPLFAPIDEILRLCDQADAILKTSKTHWEVKQAFVQINNARAHVGSIIGPLGSLLDGVELMATAKSRSSENKVSDEGLPSRETMVCITKAMSWFRRMEDWEDDAMDVTREKLSAS